MDADARGLDLDLVDMEASRCLNCGCLAVNASDLAPALVAFAAKIKTTKRILDAEDFFDAGPVRSTVLDVDELVTEIEIPTPKPTTKQTFLKFRIRNSIDFPIVSVASAISMDGDTVADARIVLGAVAPVPLRAREVEGFLKGKVLNDEIAEAAAAVAFEQLNVQHLNSWYSDRAQLTMENFERDALIDVEFCKDEDFEVFARIFRKVND